MTKASISEVLRVVQLIQLEPSWSDERVARVIGSGFNHQSVRHIRAKAEEILFIDDDKDRDATRKALHKWRGNGEGLTE